jgi:hypothetical protein
VTLLGATSVPVSASLGSSAAVVKISNPDPLGVDHARGVVPRVSQGQDRMRRPTLGTSSTNPNCGACNPPLLFHIGRPVVGGNSGSPGHVTISPVYWAPSGYSFSTTYKSIVNGYLQNVAAASQQNTNVFSVGTQYYQQASSTSPKQFIQYVVTAGAEIDDTTAYPASGGHTGCVAQTGYTVCVSDPDLQTELQSRLTALSKPINDSNLYLVLFPSGVETCSSAGNSSCTSNTYCAYHSSHTVGSGSMLYANEPYPDLAHCSDPFNGAQAPNGDPEADAQVSLISHEANETITDWGSAWFDSAGYEDGDECAYVYGVPLGSTGGSGTFYNQVIGSGKYYTQLEFSNEDYALGAGEPTTTNGTKVTGCIHQEELPTASFTFSANPMSGVSVSFNASASSDADNTGPLTYSWNWGDGTANGTGATPTHIFALAGTHAVTLTVTDADAWSGSTSHSLTVAQSPPTSTSSLALQHPAADKVAYLHDGSLLEGYFDGTKGVIDQVKSPSTAPSLTQVLTIPGDEVTIYTSPGAGSTDIWIQAGNELVGGSAALEQIQHGTYDGTKFTWDTLTTIPGAVSPGRQDPSVTWTGKWVIATWWDDTSGSNSDNVFMNWTTDKTAKTGWQSSAILLTSTGQNPVQVNVRHSTKLGATIVFYGAHCNLYYRTLLDSRADPSAPNWTSETLIDGSDDCEGGFGGPQVAIDENSGAIHMFKAVTTSNGPSWSGVTYWKGTPDATPMATGAIAWNPRLIIDSTGTSSTNPPDIAGAVDSNGKVYVFWTTSVTSGAIKYVTLVSPFTSASAESTLATSGIQPRYPHVPAQAPLSRGYVPVVYQTATSSPFNIALDTSITASGPGYSQSPQGNWVSSYGADGYDLLGWNGGSDLSSMPKATVVIDQGGRFQWTASTTAIQALESPDTTSRRATCIYDPSQIRLHLSFPAAYSGNLHLYMMDWDSTSRRESITINDGSGPQTANVTTDFSQGAWVSVPINVAANGSVTITATNAAGANAVISGIFLGGLPAVPTAPSGLTASAVSSSQINLSWTGSSGATTYYKIQRSPDGSNGWAQVGTSLSTAFSDAGLSASTTYFYRVLASSGGGDSTPSNVASAITGAALSYSQSPQGNWVSSYGADGYDLLGWNGGSDLSSMPKATVVIDQGGRFQWTASTTAIQALESPDTTSRRATCIYDPSQIRLHLSFPAAYSGNLHLYVMDWDSTSRRESITINDGSGPQTANVTTDFSQGAWVSVPINVAANGSVTITATNAAGANAVISGIFLG